MGPRRVAQALCLGLLLATASLSAQQTAEQTAQKADAAYQAKRFEEAGGLYVEAARLARPGKSGKWNSMYNAACSFALAGRVDEAFTQLQAAIDNGLAVSSPAEDSDLASLHDDPRWL